MIIPTLNEEARIKSLLDRLTEFQDVVVVDGGSTDSTCALVLAHPSSPRLMRVQRGRARQLNAGADTCTGEVLVFLHADTELPEGAAEAIRRTLTDRLVLGGNFALSFDGGDRFSRLLGRWYQLQRRLGIYYGDSAIWCRREVFDLLGGYRDMPIMEDYDFVRRLERLGSTRCLAGPAVTSARRWQGHGISRTIAAWVAIRWLYLAGVSPTRLARLYPVIR